MAFSPKDHDFSTKSTRFMQASMQNDLPNHFDGTWVSLFMGHLLLDGFCRETKRTPTAFNFRWQISRSKGGTCLRAEGKIAAGHAIHHELAHIPYNDVHKHMLT